MIELVGRLLRWVVRFIGGSTLTRLLLLSLTLLCGGTGLIAVVGHIRPAWLPATIVYAVLVGWLLGRSRLAGWLCGLLVLFIGLVWLALSVGQLSIPLDLFLAALPPFLRMILLRLPPNVMSFLTARAMFSQNVLGLTDRLALWLHNAGTSTLIIDPGITSLVWGLALWLVSAWAAWIYRRHAAWGWLCYRPPCYSSTMSITPIRRMACSGSS